MQYKYGFFLQNIFIWAPEVLGAKPQCLMTTLHALCESAEKVSYQKPTKIPIHVFLPHDSYDMIGFEGNLVTYPARKISLSTKPMIRKGYLLIPIGCHIDRGKGSQ